MKSGTASGTPAPAGAFLSGRMRWLLAALSLAVLALLSLAVIVGKRAPFRGGVLVDGNAEALADYGPVPAFALVTQAGDSLHLSDLRGRPWIADFVFTTCGSICPMMSAQFERLSGQVDAAVRLVSFSVDPERDTPEKLAEYGARYGAEPGRWLFLTGDKPQVRRLVQEGFRLSVQDATPEDIAAGSDAILHSTRFVLVDAEARIRGYYDGADAEAVERLRRDLAKLVRGEVP